MASASGELDEALKGWTASNPSVVGFVVCNSDGIPIRHHEKLSRERAVHYSALLNSFCAKARQCVRELLPSDGELQHVRIRTAHGLELVTTQTSSGHSLIAVQNCTKLPYDFGDDAAAAAQNQEAE